jgi:ammonium transporter, Amt family
MRLVRKLSPFLLILLLSSTLMAQAASAVTDTAVPGSQIAQLQQQIADAKGSADNAWMLMCSALVLLMTGPGLALFYGGLVRKKNVLATMMQSFAMMALVTVLWAIIGYSLCFGSGNSFIGGVEHAFLHGVGAAPDADYAPQSRNRRS